MASRTASVPLEVTRHRPVGAVPRWVENAVERSVVLQDIDYLVGLAVDRRLHQRNRAIRTERL